MKGFLSQWQQRICIQIQTENLPQSTEPNLLRSTQKVCEYTSLYSQMHTSSNILC